MQSAMNINSLEEKILQRLERLSEKTDSVQLMYYNPKAKDKSALDIKLPFDPKLIDGQKFILKIEGESERYYRLFLFYLNNRSFDLVQQETMGMGKRLNKRQIFNIARKFKWKERTAKYDSEINCEIMENMHAEYVKLRHGKFRNLVNIMYQANLMIKSLDEYCSIDFESLKKDRGLSDMDRLRHIKLFVGIYKDFLFITSKCEQEFADYGVSSYDPFSAFNEFDKEFSDEEFDDPFAELEERDRRFEMEMEEEEVEEHYAENTENTVQFDATFLAPCPTGGAGGGVTEPFTINNSIENQTPTKNKLDVACNVSTIQNESIENYENLVQKSVIYRHKSPEPPRPKPGTLEEALYKLQHDEFDFDDEVEEDEISENDDEDD